MTTIELTEVERQALIEVVMAAIKIFDAHMSQHPSREIADRSNILVGISERLGAGDKLVVGDE